MKKLLLLLPLLSVTMAQAQLVVSVSPPKVVGQKAVVSLGMKNGFSENVESARAVCFVLDEQGKMVGQGTRWVIGGEADKAGLPAGATNLFHFVIASDKPFVSTNLAARVSFSRVVLENGKLADPAKQVIITMSTAK